MGGICFLLVVNLSLFLLLDGWDWWYDDCYLLDYFYKLFYLNNWPNLLFDFLDSVPKILLFVYDGIPLIAN